MKKQKKFKKQRLLLTCILKGDSEYEMAARMLTSFMPHFQGLAVALTGLNEKFDKTISLIEKLGGKYIITNPQTHPKIYGQDEKGKVVFANFAEARNASFDLAAEMQKEEPFDWWSWADVDDMLLHGDELQRIAQVATIQKLDEVLVTYWYAINVHKDGTYSDKDVLIDHVRERLLKPNIFKWQSRLHELALPADGTYQPKYSVYNYMPKGTPETPGAIQKCVWAHLSTPKRITDTLSRNARILEIQAREENHKDPRTLFYLAKVYADFKDPIHDALCQELIKEYLEMSGWPEERSNAWEYLADIALRRKDKQKAIECLLKAKDEYPMRHMPYLLLAREYADIGKFDLSNFYLDQVTKMDPPSARTTIGNPFDIKMMTASLLYNKAIREARIEDAIYWMKIRGKLVGEDFKDAIETLEQAKLYNDAGTWLHNYAIWLKENGHSDLIPNLLTAVPADMAKEPFVQKFRLEYVKPRTWGKRKIAYFASGGGEHFEQWSPKSLQKGIGGSETAVIKLAEEWAKKGWKVTVFCDCGEEAGEYGGVTYKPWYELNWKDKFNILILWRSPHLLDQKIKANKIMMDLHDVASQIDWTEERMAKISKVFFKSQYHRSMLPKLPDEKAAIISNGI